MGMVLKNLNGIHISTMVGQWEVLFFPMWFLLTLVLIFESFNYFILPPPMSLRLFLSTVDWLWSLSLLSIPIHSPIFFNYQSYLFYPFPYTMSIFYPFYTFLFILSILSIVSNSIHVNIHFHIFCHFLSIPIRFVNSFQFVQICGLLLFIPIH
jgi:hypothetical protein